MKRILVSSLLMAYLAVAGSARAQQDPSAGPRCDLDGLPGAEVLVRYPLKHNDKHIEDHIPWGIGGAEPVAIPGEILFGGAPRVIAVADFLPGGPCDLLWEEFDPQHPQDHQPRIAVTQGITGPLVFDYGMPRPPLPWDAAGALDVTGDGMADVLWWNPATGAALLWVRRTGGWSVAGVEGGFPPTEAEPREGSLTAIVRFEADGPAGVIWADRTHEGLARYYQAGWNGHTLTLTPAGSVLGLEWDGWSIAAVADFDGDGRDDLLRQRQSDSELFVCYMDGLSLRRPCERLHPATLEIPDEDYLGWFVTGPR